MPRTLALDIGERRTGAAFCDDAAGVPLAIDTIQHQSADQLVEAVLRILAERNVHRVVIGLPLLLSGKEGLQCRLVRQAGDALVGRGISVAYLDERYTTKKNNDFDGDAASACQILLTYLELEA